MMIVAVVVAAVVLVVVIYQTAWSALSNLKICAFFNGVSKYL
jgi:hypothetical protein